ncbi:MAG: Uma2 family endonuclease [Candidatus Eremiobacteraeota bacterium]|nr:Uma2 family endonuclease [Candidatus Eremiobacteraeota bacterium]
MTTITTTAPRLMTADELLALPKRDMLHELIDGELRTMAPAGERHGEIGIALARVLSNHVFDHRLGRVYGADTGFRLRRDPDTVRAPDVAFVDQTRLQGPVGGPKYFEGAPDLAVEVLSPNDSVIDLEDKLADFFAAGCRLAWVVNPHRDTLTVYIPPGTPVRVLGLDDVLDGGDVVPGFSHCVRDLLYWPV